MNGIPGTDLVNWLSRGWKTFKSQPKPLILASVILNVIAMPMVFNVLMPTAAVPMWGWVVWAFIFFLLLFPILMVGWCALLLKAVREAASRRWIFFPAFRVLDRRGVRVFGLPLCCMEEYFCSLFRA